MKILHVFWGLENGGTENMVVDIINCQISSADVHALIINDKMDKSIIERIDKKCRIICLNRKIGSKSPFVFLRLNWIIFKEKYDIVHLHYAYLIDKLFVPANYVRTVHNTNQYSHNYKWHKAVIAISEAVKKYLNSNGISNVIQVNNGINASLIKTRDKVEINSPFKIVQVSRLLFKQKGQDILLKALDKLVSSGVNNIRLDFIGCGEDEIILRNLIKDLNLDSCVRLLGNKDRQYVYNHLKDYDLFVQPSRYEGFGLTVAEAMIAQVPVLVSDIEGPLQIVENGAWGYTFSCGDSDDCAEKIRYIINNYPTEEFLEKAKKHISTTYDVSFTAHEYLNIYKKVQENK